MHRTTLAVIALSSVVTMGVWGEEPLPVVRLPSEAAFGGTAVDAAARGALLSGHWRIDSEESDDPRALVTERLEASRVSTHIVSDPGGRNDGHGTLGTLPRFRSKALNSDRRRAGQDLPIPELPRDLRLAYQSPALRVIGGDGQSRVWYTDNRGASVSAMGGGDQETVTAGWEGNILVVERISPLGPGTIERYRVNSETGKLEVDVVLMVPGAKGAIEYQMVYDRVKETTVPGEQKIHSSVTPAGKDH